MRKQMALSISQRKASSTKWRHHPAELFNTMCTTFCHFTKSPQKRAQLLSRKKRFIHLLLHRLTAGNCWEV